MVRGYHLNGFKRRATARSAAINSKQETLSRLAVSFLFLQAALMSLGQANAATSGETPTQYKSRCDMTCGQLKTGDESKPWGYNGVQPNQDFPKNKQCNCGPKTEQNFAVNLPEKSITAKGWARTRGDEFGVCKEHSVTPIERAECVFQTNERKTSGKTISDKTVVCRCAYKDQFAAGQCYRKVNDLPSSSTLEQECNSVGLAFHPTAASQKYDETVAARKKKETDELAFKEKSEARQAEIQKKQKPLEEDSARADRDLKEAQNARNDRLKLENLEKETAMKKAKADYINADEAQAAANKKINEASKKMSESQQGTPAYEQARKEYEDAVAAKDAAMKKQDASRQEFAKAKGLDASSGSSSKKTEARGTASTNSPTNGGAPSQTASTDNAAQPSAPSASANAPTQPNAPADLASEGQARPAQNQIGTGGSASEFTDENMRQEVYAETAIEPSADDQKVKNQPNKAAPLDPEHVGMSDSCSASVMNKILKDHPALKDKSPQEVAHELNVGSLKTTRIEYEKKYGCKAAEGFLDSTRKGMLVTQTLSTAFAGASGAYATAKVENANAEGRDVISEGNRQMGKSMVRTGISQIATGALQLWASVAAFKVSREQDAAKEAATEGEAGYGSQKALSRAGLAEAAISGKTEDQAAAANQEGGEKAAQSAAQSGRVADQASTDAIQYLVQGAVTTANGALGIVQGNEIQKLAGTNNENPIVPVNPDSAPPAEDGPPTVIGGGPTISENPATDGSNNDDKYKDATTPYGFGAPTGSGGGSSGGLKEPARPGGIAGLVGSGTTSGGGGAAAAASGGTGGGGSNPAGEKPAGVDNIGGNSAKFATVEGGSAFGAVGGGAKRSSDTGMSMDGLVGALAQFMPNQKEEVAKQGAIGILGDQANRQLASVGGDQDDGSILGRNGSLFPRVSAKLMNYYTRGNVR